MCIPATTCKIALTEADFFWPNRNKASDGICGDEAHQKRKSDHNDGNAFDLTHDPFNGLDTYSLSEQLRLSGDTRIKYVISFERIWNPSISSNWRKYSGANPHTKHMHVSIHSSARNSKASWWARFIPKELPDLTKEEHDWLGRVHHELVSSNGNLAKTLIEIRNLSKRVETLEKKVN